MFRNQLIQITPASWKIIHAFAAESITPQERMNFIHYIDHVQTNLSCPVCRGHMQEYVRNHPIKTYFNYTEPIHKRNIGMLFWSWQFHNSVNKRLGKPMHKWSDTLREYVYR